MASVGKLRRVLIANRGEIAVRVIRACRQLGLETVVVVSTADRDGLAARLADRAVCVGPPPAAQSYLAISSVLSAALGTGCDAVHPGYGFLSENPQFAAACVRAGGPDLRRSPPGRGAQAGDKAQARELARSAGIPVLVKASPATWSARTTTRCSPRSSRTVLTGTPTPTG